MANPVLTVDALQVAQPAAGQALTARLVETTVTLNEALKVSSILKDTTAVAALQIENEKHMPDGALQDVTAPTPTKMVTWNALIKVKK